MEIIEVVENKKQYLNLLLLGDEQESMIDRYLDRGRMYILSEKDVIAVCVVTDEGNGILEIKNLAVKPDSQRNGYGKQFIEYIKDTYRGHFHTLQVGTGDSPSTIPFYEKCGFKRSGYSVKNFFLDNYYHPVYDGGVQLMDMVYLEMKI